MKTGFSTIFLLLTCFSVSVAQRAIPSKIDHLLPRPKAIAPLNNFSDSVFAVQLPPEVLWRFQCAEIEPFMNEAAAIQREENFQFEDTANEPRKFYFQPEECTEGIIWVDRETAVAEKYFTNEDYFTVWDTRNVNPYDIKIGDFKDTISFELFNREKGSAWASPLARPTKVNSKYGPRWYRWHHGIDLKIELGDPIHAVFDGVVRIAKYNRGGYGYYVMIRHENGLETLYGHLAKYNVKPGDVVKAGDVIGYGGNTGRSTGPHLHFEVRYQGHAFDPRHLFDFNDGGGRLYFRDFVLTPYHYKGLINEAKGQYHRVRNGESLWVISRRYRTPIRRLCSLNGISRSTVLRVGRVLRVR